MFFFFNDTATTEIYTLSLHDALPILLGAGETGRQMVRTLKDEWGLGFRPVAVFDYQLTEQGGLIEDVPYAGTVADALATARKRRSEEHTSELQSRQYLVCRLLLEKKQ